MVAGWTRGLALGVTIGLIVPSAVTAAEPRERQGALRPLLDCRKISDTTERLACFDRESATLDEADKKKELTVMDKEDVRKTRRSLFGFNVSDVPFIDNEDEGKDAGETGDREAEAADRITAKIESARSTGNGKWAFSLEGGAHWVTTEAVIYRQPEAGMEVVIKKGAMGGFSAGFGGTSRQVRVRRVN